MEENRTMETRKENKMGVMPVGKLLINVSLPMMISMFVQALYNVVDSIFVAQVGDSALAAVSLAMSRRLFVTSTPSAVRPMATAATQPAALTRPQSR